MNLSLKHQKQILEKKNNAFNKTLNVTPFRVISLNSNATQNNSKLKKIYSLGCKKK